MLHKDNSLESIQEEGKILRVDGGIVDFSAIINDQNDYDNQANLAVKEIQGVLATQTIDSTLPSEGRE